MNMYSMGMNKFQALAKDTGAILKKFQIKSTFFLIGVKQKEEILRTGETYAKKEKEEKGRLAYKSKEEGLTISAHRKACKKGIYGMHKNDF